MNVRTLQWAALGSVILLFAVIVLVVALPSGEQVAENEQTRQPESLSVGEGGILNTNDDPANCEGIAIVSRNKESYGQLQESFAADDQIGFAALMESGAIFSVPNCTEVLMIGNGEGFLSFSSEVRITDTDNSHFAETGFVPYEFAIQK